MDALIIAALKIALAERRITFEVQDCKYSTMEVALFYLNLKG